VDYDLVVIGGGAAGLGAARAGRRAGARTLLITDGQPGGDCTFTGCVPSKTLVESARQRVPYPVAAQRIRDVIARIAATEDAAALRREGIDVILARGRFRDPAHIDAGGQTVTGRRFVVATGTAPAIPPIPGLATAPYLTNETIFDLPALPGRLAVLGGGASGCELAQAYARLGSHVTLIEKSDRLLPREDPDASRLIATIFAREGIETRLGAPVRSVSAEPDSLRLSLVDGPVVTADRLLVTVGRRPVTDDLDLPAAGVRLDDAGNIVTDHYLATTRTGIYAAGDITGGLRHTHAAFEMGRTAAINALGPPWRRRRYDPYATPWVTFTDPEVAQVGTVETDAAARGGRVAFLPMDEMDRALTAARTDGFIKLIAGPRPLLRNLGGGRILGATIVATRAGEMIHEPALAMATRMFAGRLAATTHAYPTWSYGVQLAAAQFFMPIGDRRARRPAANG
jgi:pyruvate/2-oxoglutarate dehydrogenase complex dihydrolipoamide dehydrogenase (E3) component